MRSAAMEEPCSPLSKDGAADVVFPPFGAWDFPMSRAEKVRRLLLVFEAEAEGAELEASALRAENAALKRKLDQGSGAETGAAEAPPTWLPGFGSERSAEKGEPRRRKTCVFAIPEVEPVDRASEEASLRAQRRTAPVAVASRSCEIGSEAALPDSAFSPPASPVPSSRVPDSPPSSSRLPDGRAAPPAPRRRRRTTIFHLPPETSDGPATGAETWPMRAKRRTAPPTVLELAAAQAAGEAAMASCVMGAPCGLGEAQPASSFTPVSCRSPASSAPASPRTPSPAALPRSPSPTALPQLALSSMGPAPAAPADAWVPTDWSLTPRKSVLSARSCASAVAAVQWRGDEAVEWLHFVPRGADRGRVDEDNLEQPISGELVLMRGEYIQIMRGRSQVSDGRVADWVEVVTSMMRSVTIGSPHHSDSRVPTFSCAAEAGQELCGVSYASDGSISDVLQRPLGGHHC